MSDESFDRSLKESSVSLDILFDRMPMVIAIIDRDYRLRRFNPAWKKFAGLYTPSAEKKLHPGSYYFDLFPGTEPVVEPLFERVLSGETIRQDAVRLETEGIVSYWDVVLAPLVQDGEIIGIFDVGTDATERVLAKQQLEQRVEERTHELERRRQVAEELRDILAVLNSTRSFEEILDYIVQQARRLLGASAGVIYRGIPEEPSIVVDAANGAPQELLELGKLPFYPEAVNRALFSRRPFAVANLDTQVTTDLPEGVEYLDQTMVRWKQVIRSNYRAYLTVPLIIKDELYGALALYYTEPRQFSEEDLRLGMSLGDQVALAIENARLRDQVEQSAVAAERNRLARDLHDAVTQTLFSVTLIAEVLPRLWERDQQDARSRLEELRQLTRGAMAEMRTLLLELRPATLVEAEVDELFRHLVDAFIGRARVPVDMKIAGECDLPPDVKIALYRIAQEMLNNVAKHAGATQVNLRLECMPDQISLSVSDNGSGFDPQQISSEHLGLNIMRERAESIGAEMRVESRMGEGTRIAVSLTQRETDQR